jgi:hypothetical protein
MISLLTEPFIIIDGKWQIEHDRFMPFKNRNPNVIKRSLGIQSSLGLYGVNTKYAIWRGTLFRNLFLLAGISKLGLFDM